MISIFLHLYYPESVKTVLPLISNEFLQGNKLYVNLVSSVPFDETVFTTYENLTLIKTPNVGKDIGGKLALIDSALTQDDDSDFWIFLHDKSSPHTSTGKFWRESLFSIADIKNRDQILTLMADPDTNVVTHRSFIRDEWNPASKKFDTINHEIITELLKEYNVSPPSYQFAAGTMFWAKSKPMKSFFTKYHPLKIRTTIEAGNVLDHHKGTYAHSWERLLSWVALDKTKNIAGM